ncbi:MAG: hypothetical protein HWN66_19725 [Candidatus Helarchaeota archaeon]|nr:hypothetical protein [Candidatus Helarchaeota archaeon]
MPLRSVEHSEAFHLPLAVVAKIFFKTVFQQVPAKRRCVMIHDDCYAYA